MTDSANRQIGDYTITHDIGTGGMATVYKARQGKLGRDVALKMMHSIFQQDPNFIARFEREAQIVARLDHPNIVPIYDYDDFEGQPYLVMKYIEGHTLKDVLRKGTLPLGDIRDLMRKVASALDYAHRRGVFHRDIKPSNVLLTGGGVPYLTDFGLARIAQQGESTMSVDTMLGTPQYMSPEQAQGLDIDSRTDVYSLGVVLYELVVGRVPFLADSAYAIIHKQIYAAPPDPTTLNPDVPPAVAAVLLQALEKDPADRYPTAGELIDAFEDAIHASGLQQLSEDRQSVAASLAPDVSEHTPGGDQYVSVPVPGENQAAEGSFQQFADEVGKRVRGLFQEVTDEIKKNVEANKISSKVRDGARTFRETTTNSVREWQTSESGSAKPTGQDWREDESTVRQRVDRRWKKRRALFIHTGIYVLVIGFLTFFGQANYENALSQALLEPDIAQTIAEVGGDFITPLQQINIGLALALLWGGGLAGHALSVFYDSGRRLERKRQRMENELEAAYGPHWRELADEDAYRRVRRRVESGAQKRLALLTHFVHALLFTLFAVYLWGPLGEGLQPFAEQEPVIRTLVDSPFPAIIALVLLVPVLIHGMVIGVGSVISAEPDERTYAYELERERELSGLSAASVKPKRTPQSLRLTEDGELSESFVDELTIDKQKSDER